MSKKNKKNANKRNVSIKKRQKKQSNLSKVLNTSKNEWTVKRSYFRDLSPNEIRNNVSRIANYPFFKSAICLTIYDNYKYIYGALTPDTELIKVLNWSIGLIIYHKNLIRKFIIIEDQLTKSILDGQYEQAISLLNELDEICGLSTWSIAIRGTILKIADQHNDSQDFLKKIFEKCDENDLFKYICNSMINRYDDSTMILSSTTSLKKQIMRNYKGNFQTFLIYKIIPKDFSVEYKINYTDVFNYEKNASLIDLFKAIINFLADTLNSNNPNDIECAKIAAVNLSQHFSYYILENLSTYYGVNPKWEHNKNYYDLIDAYSIGNYKEVCSMAKQNPSEFDNFTVFELIARSAARTSQNPYNGLKKDIVSNLINIFIKQDNYQKSLSYLQTMCYAFPDLPWFQELLYLIQRESHYIDDSTNTHLITLSSAFSRVNSPRKAITLPIEFQEAYLESCNDKINSSVSIKLYEIMKEGNIECFNDISLKNLEYNRFLKYKAKLLLKNGIIEEAIPLLEELSLSTDSIVSNDAIQLLVDSYIDFNQDEKAIELFVNTSLENINLIRRFNTFRICDVAEKNVNSSKSICVPIALSLHSMYVDSTYDSVLRYSFEKFLNNTGANHPLEIIDKCPNIKDIQLNYFFEHVCTQNVMKLSFLFDNKTEIEDCRIAVCTHLIEKNISKSTLVNEVKEITKEQLIKKAVTHVDQSRIHADLSGFRDSRSQAFRDGFNYYVELNKKDYSTFEDEISLKQIYSALNSLNEIPSNTSSVMLLNMPLNEKNLKFHNLIKMLRDEFTFGQKGLNNYLSTRIRHGVLPNNIRTCVSKENLVTPIDTIKNIPKSNIYWINRLGFLPSKECSEIDKALKKFTSDFDKIITEINDEWLQIVSLDQDIENLKRGGSKIKALFNYSISNVESYALQKLIKDEDYENFIRIISQWLWKKTETNLDAVKSKIKLSAKNSFSECFTSLSERINKAVTNQETIAPLHDAISRSKDSLFTALNIVASWFTISKTDAIKEFELSTAIEIAQRPANIIVNHNNLPDGLLFKGKHLNSFVDILYILFDNAATKSNLQRDELKVDVSLTVGQNDIITLTVINNCQHISDIVFSNEQLDYYRKHYGNDDLLNIVVQQEGGTGIFKIGKILSRDIEIKNKIEFGYKSNSSFEVKILMQDPNGVLSHENTISRGSV
ncbi:hypothetical protein JCM14469_34610 [Desulfatiferula olefinivorans]